MIESRRFEKLYFAFFVFGKEVHLQFLDMDEKACKSLAVTQKYSGEEFFHHKLEVRNEF